MRLNKSEIQAHHLKGIIPRPRLFQNCFDKKFMSKNNFFNWKIDKKKQRSNRQRIYRLCPRKWNKILQTHSMGKERRSETMESEHICYLPSALSISIWWESEDGDVVHRLRSADVESPEDLWLKVSRRKESDASRKIRNSSSCEDNGSCAQPERGSVPDWVSSFSSATSVDSNPSGERTRAGDGSSILDCEGPLIPSSRAFSSSSKSGRNRSMKDHEECEKSEMTVRIRWHGWEHNEEDRREKRRERKRWL